MHSLISLDVADLSVSKIVNLHWVAEVFVICTQFLFSFNVFILTGKLTTEQANA